MLMVGWSNRFDWSESWSTYQCKCSLLYNRLHSSYAKNRVSALLPSHHCIQESKRHCHQSKAHSSQAKAPEGQVRNLVYHQHEYLESRKLMFSVERWVFSTGLGLLLRESLVITRNRKLWKFCDGSKWGGEGGEERVVVHQRRECMFSPYIAHYQQRWYSKLSVRYAIAVSTGIKEVALYQVRLFVQLAPARTSLFWKSLSL